MRSLKLPLLVALLVLAVIGGGVWFWVDSQGGFNSGDSTNAVTPGAGQPGLQYVALGDSYTSGYGVEPLVAASGECARSTANYPQLVAKDIGATLTDVSCSGADTADVLTSQEGGVPAQLDALASAPDVVTLTIGGNNSNLFAGTLQACATAGLQARGLGSPCEDQYGDEFEDTINDEVYPALVDVLEAVRERVPDAKVAVVGYPWILPQETGCFDVLPIAPGDMGYVRDLQMAVNEAVKEAASETDTTFVDMGEVSEGHDACATPAQQWIDPTTVHPNVAGQAAMAAEVSKALNIK